MPYASYAAMTDADVAALYDYFMKEVKPVRMVPPKTMLPFPFNQRWALYFWDAAFVKHEVFKPRGDRGVEWNRGAYLVQTLGHCGSCHTPRGPGYQERGYDESSPHFLTGAVVDHWYAADLSGNRASGLGRRSQAELVALLRSGHGAGDMVFGSMRDVVQESTQYLHDDDLAAIALYLKSLPARGEQAHYRPYADTAGAPVAGVAAAALRERPGAGVYNGFCAKCHGAEGTGKSGKFPALAGNPAVMLPDPASMIRLLIEGGTAPRTVQNPTPEKMPPFDGKLRDTDIADVLTYIRASWGNGAGPVTVRRVARAHASLLKDRIKGATLPAN